MYYYTVDGVVNLYKYAIRENATSERNERVIDESVAQSAPIYATPQIAVINVALRVHFQQRGSLSLLLTILLKCILVVDENP